MPRYWKTESWQCGRCAAQKRRASTAERVNRGNTLPTFTFNGLRYAEIVGAGPIAAADIEAAVIGSDLRRTGWLHTSDPLVNRLHKNVFWGMRGNFLDVPTDCPQRDERLGWTGDIQVFAPTANYLFNSAGFLSNWLYDLSLEQKPDGGVPFIVPDVLRNPDPAAAAWGDAATFVPSALYAGYDDRQMLARQYPSMRAWVETVRSLVSPSGLWDTGFQFRDWRDPTAPEEDSARAQADPHVVATAYFARSTHLLADAASVLGRPDDAATYEAVASQAVVAFNRAYVAVDGTVLSDCQTVYALALNWGLITDVTARRKAGERLAALVRDADYRVSTGFVGTPLILDALCLAGQPSLAFGMLLQRECRSWLYAVTMGATTVWERWDSMLPDGIRCFPMEVSIPAR
jgi:alpha-L-rhamnosidase